MVRSEPAELALRELRPDDSAAVRSLATAGLEGLNFRSAFLAAVDAVLGAGSPEARGIVATSAGRVDGLGVFGTIAGTVGAGRLQLVVVDGGARRRGIATRIVNEAVGALGSAGARFVIVELPTAPALAASRNLLESCGFRIESVVADYFRDGVDLAILRYEIAAS